MKKTLFAAIAFLAVMATACQNTDNGNKESALKENEEQIKQRVEQMFQMHELFDADKILTADMLAVQNQAQSVHFWADFCPGFQWDLGIQDVCSDEQKVNIEGINTIDSLHCDVAMRYVDEGCYDMPYTLNLLKENGEWKIDNVIFNDGEGTLRDNCKAFYDDMVDTYSTTTPEEIMEFLSQEEPAEELYTDPECIFYNNPEEIKHLIGSIENCRELFKQNPGYTEEYENQINAMIERIASHI